MLNQFSRTEMLIKKEGIEKLQNAKIAVFGIGGVGSFAVEGLVRAGIKKFVLIDGDKISLTNLNRQLIATTKTIGKYKVEVMKERILEINPEAEVEIYKEFFSKDSENNIITKDLTYVVDCIDMISSKLEIIMQCKNLNIPIISAMGTGNKLNPAKFEITDVYNTSVCPLAKVMRKELKKRGITELKVIYSKEEPIKVENNIEIEDSIKKSIPGSISFVPSVAGLMIAGEVVKDILFFRK